MYRQMAIVTALMVCTVVGASRADEGSKASWLDALDSIVERDTLTDNWFTVGDRLDAKGLSIGLSLTEIYQINTHGGLATDRRKGRESGSYGLEIEADLEKLISLPGGSVYMLIEGSWSDGVDGVSVGSIFGVNDDAGGNRKADVTQLYYQQNLFEEKLRVRVGKIDLTGCFECRGCPGSFDGNTFANDETTQFMNAALVNNPTVPFPAEGLAATLHVQPDHWWYLSAGIADAQADARETGLATTFHDEDYFFSIVEAGVTPEITSANGSLRGTVRVGLWYDPQDKARNSGSTKRDDMGVYLSADQVVMKESDDEEDTQGLGLFARFGCADHDVSAVRCFWCAGAQYQGLLPVRDNDVVALGMAQGRLTKSAGFTETSETVTEAYYSAAVTGWLSVSPSVQYVINPGGVNTVKDAVIFGLRLQMAF